MPETSVPIRKRAVFLDRDGTLNVEKEYLFRPEEFVFTPDAPKAIKALRQAGFLVVVVTNQSGVARGYFPVAMVETLHRFIQNELSAFGTKVDAFYYCPHHPAADDPVYGRECDCRKPRPGMLLQAAEEFDIDLENSYMVGDKCADLLAGIAAGAKPVLVLTGYGNQERPKADPAIPCYADLAAASAAILAGTI